MRINYYIYAEDEKLVQELGKASVFSKALARSMYPHLTEDSEIFFESRSRGACSRNTTFFWTKPVIIWNDKTRVSTTRRAGVSENVYNVLDTAALNESKAEYKIFPSIKLINEVNIVNSVQPYRCFIDGISGGLTTTPKPARRRFPIIIRCVLRTLTF